MEKLPHLRLYGKDVGNVYVWQSVRAMNVKILTILLLLLEVLHNVIVQFYL